MKAVEIIQREILSEALKILTLDILQLLYRKGEITVAEIEEYLNRKHELDSLLKETWGRKHHMGHSTMLSLILLAIGELERRKLITVEFDTSRRGYPLEKFKYDRFHKGKMVKTCLEKEEKV